MYELFQDDCYQAMDALIERGVQFDAIITDPPYGVTGDPHDRPLDLDALWPRLAQLRTPEAAVVLFGQEPYASEQRISNRQHFKYDWIWDKGRGNNFTQVKRQPFKSHEIISVFYRHAYYPQMRAGKPYKQRRDHQSISYRIRRISGDNPTGQRYPLSILSFKPDRGYHPAQKPVGLLDYLIRTYTQEGERVLDFCMGSGSTGVAALGLNREFVGIEQGATYFETARQRIEETNDDPQDTERLCGQKRKRQKTGRAV